MNAIKGEFTAKLGGKEFKFKTGTNQTAIFESISGLSLVEYAQAFEDPTKLKITNIRGLLYSCLVAAKNTVSVEDVGDLLDETEPEELQTILQKIGNSQALGSTKKK